MEIRELKPQDLDAPGLRTLLHMMRGANGLSSMQHNLEHQLYLLNKSIAHDKRRTWVALVDDVIVGMGSLVLHEESPFYSLETHRVELIEKNWELCGAFVNPSHQKRGIYRALLEHRLAFLKSIDTDAKWVTIEVRAPYHENGDPLVQKENRSCWRQEPYYIYGLISLKGPLKNEMIFVAEESRAVFNFANELGFEVYGINAYDNGPHMRRPI